MAIRFASDGARLTLVDLDSAALEEAREAVAVLGRGVETETVDVTDSRAVSLLGERVGGVDVLVNNAGVVHGGEFARVPLERHELTVRVNVLGVITMTHVFLPGMIERPEASVVNIASASGFIGLPYGSTYAASKWAVIGFSESLRLELESCGHDHVRVTTVCPSYIDTGLFAGASPPKATRMLSAEHIAEKVVRAVVHGRPWVIEPWLARITPPLKGVLPTRVFDSIASALGATDSMLHWRGRER
jgi:short-subunit dehydrogenase